MPPSFAFGDELPGVVVVIPHLQARDRMDLPHGRAPGVASCMGKIVQEPSRQADPALVLASVAEHRRRPARRGRLEGRGDLRDDLGRVVILQTTLRAGHRLEVDMHITIGHAKGLGDIALKTDPTRRIALDGVPISRAIGLGQLR
jgi:hypothetical protein